MADASVDVRDLEPGDRVLWGDRVEPLVVLDTDVRLTGPADLRGVRVESQRGTVYVIHETPLGFLRVLRKVKLSPDNPNGLTSEARIQTLRRAD